MTLNVIKGNFFKTLTYVLMDSFCSCFSIIHEQQVKYTMVLSIKLKTQMVGSTGFDFTHNIFGIVSARKTCTYYVKNFKFYIVLLRSFVDHMTLNRVCVRLRTEEI